MKELTNKVLLKWKGLQTRCSNISKPQKDDDLRDWMRGLVRSKIQKVQRFHQLECSYASFMLLLRYSLCLFYTNYASTEKQCYVFSFLSVYFSPTQRRRTILAIVWEVRFGHHFRRSKEFMSLNVCMLLLCYHYVIVYAVFTKGYASTKKFLKKLCYVNTMLLCLFMLSCCYGSQYLLCLYEETFSSYCYTFTRTHIFKGLVTLLNFCNHMNMIFWLYDKQGSITFILSTVTTIFKYI